jgi:hypothetical protein
VGERKKDLLWLETEKTVSTKSSEIAMLPLNIFNLPTVIQAWGGIFPSLNNPWKI